MEVNMKSMTKMLGCLKDQKGSGHIVVGFMTIFLFCVLGFIALYIVAQPVAARVLEALKALFDVIH
jgi:hypothetical protein